MFLKVNQAQYISDFKLELRFNNDEIKQVDLKDELYGEIFEPLRNKDFFQDFFISYNTVEWKNGADFAPEFLYKIGQKV